jgi:hypothetical protein
MPRIIPVISDMMCYKYSLIPASRVTGYPQQCIWIKLIMSIAICKSYAGFNTNHIYVSV